MAALWILILIVATYVITISLVVVGQEIHFAVAVVLFAGVAYGAYKLFQTFVDMYMKGQTRLTRL